MNEGRFDRSGQNSELLFIRKRIWNYAIGNTSLKVRLINNTGAPTVYGSIVAASTVIDMGFVLAPTDAVSPFGVVYEAGIADGEECFVITNGLAEVLLQDNHAPTRGDWVRTSSTTAGRAYTEATPAAAPTHFQEIGHCLVSEGSGTDVLCVVNLHFL